MFDIFALNRLSHESVHVAVLEKCAVAEQIVVCFEYHIDIFSGCASGQS